MKTFLATLMALGLALPLSADGLEDMTEAERQNFRAEVRAYLLENPEVLMEAIAVLEQRQEDAQANADGDLVLSNAADIFDDGHSWVGGNPDGDITIVEFLDYRCGFCKRAFPEVQALIEGDSNIRLIVKEFPILGEDSVLASRFAIATLQVAGADAYQSVHDALMVMRGNVNDAALSRIASEVGLDEPAIRAAMNDEKVTAIIQKNRELGQKLQINGTPSFIFEDQMVRGYVELNQMRALVEQLRNES